MKRFLSKVIILVCAMLLLAPSSGLASLSNGVFERKFSGSQEDWNRSCNYKLAASVTLYCVFGENLESIGSLPAGTYVVPVDNTDDKRKIEYMYNGNVYSAWTYKLSIKKASSIVRGANGIADNVSDLDPDYDKKMQSGVVEYDAKTQWAKYPDTTAVEMSFDNGEYHNIFADGQETNGEWNQPGFTPKDAKGIEQENTTPWTHSGTSSAPKKSASQSSSATNNSPADGKVTASAPSGNTKSGEGSSQPKSQSSTANTTESANAETDGKVTVSVEKIGTQESVIMLNGEKTTVATESLTFGKDVPEEKAVAYVYAPNTGKVSLRTKASTSSDAIKQVKGGTVVGIIENGKSFSLVNNNGVTGYISNKSLKFMSTDKETMGKGMLTYNGKGTGRTTVNVRNGGSKSAKVIAEWKTGTEVTVFSLKDGWYEIESGGVHGFVMDDFLTMQ